MRKLIPIFLLLTSIRGWTAQASQTIKFNYTNADIQKIIAEYAAATGQHFIIDADVKGRGTIINPTPVSHAEAFNQLSLVLAGNGYGITFDGEPMRVMSARNLQRNNIPVVLDVPSAAPERMVTWVYRMKFGLAEEVNKQLRILSSRDGEMVPFSPNNELVISDWATNIRRIAAILKEIDVPGKK